MCIQEQNNFYHKCTHVQTVTIPSINSECSHYRVSCSYQLGYCPRCSWQGSFIPGILVPVSYEQEFPAIPCFTAENKRCEGKVMATVSLPRQERYSGVNLMKRRKRFLENEDNGYYQFLGQRHLQLYEDIAKAERAEGKTGVERTYWMWSKPAGDSNDWYEEDRLLAYNPCPDFYDMNPARFAEVHDDHAICFCQGGLRDGIVDPYDETQTLDRCNGGGIYNGPEYTADNSGEQAWDGGHPIVFPCGHAFGMGCARGWIEGIQVGFAEPTKPSNKCPKCNQIFKIEREKILKIDWLPEGWHRDLTLEQLPAVEKGWRIFQEMGRYYLIWIIFMLLLNPPYWLGIVEILVGTVGAIHYHVQSEKFRWIKRVEFRPYERFDLWQWHIMIVHSILQFEYWDWGRSYTLATLSDYFYSTSNGLATLFLFWYWSRTAVAYILRCYPGWFSHFLPFQFFNRREMVPEDEPQAVQNLDADDDGGEN